MIAGDITKMKQLLLVKNAKIVNEGEIFEADLE